MATIAELLDTGKQRLELSGNAYAQYERKVLLEEATGQPYMYMLLHGDEPVEPEAEKRYLSWIEKRTQHYPLQYITGKAPFMDYEFYVNENVLIPRNDTEILVETALTCVPEQQSGEGKLLDLCCGSGCIGISMKLYRPYISLTLSDISDAALAVTGRNCERYAVEASVIQSDLFENLQENYDWIISNPPYIESKIVDTLMPEVRDYEPRLALDGGADGLDFYKRILHEASGHLRKQGWLFFEIGCDQANALEQLMHQNGYKDIKIQKDYAGLDRVIYGHL